jgi:hypothetical protein
VNSRTASHVKSLNLVSIDDLVEGVDKSHDDSDDQQLLRTHSPDDPSKGDQHRRHAIGRPRDGELVDSNVVSFEFVENLLPEGAEENVKLDHDGIDEESVGEGGVSVGLDEGHQKTETDEHHHVRVLKSTVSLVNQFVGTDGRRDVGHPHEDDEENEDQDLENQ